MPEQDLHQRRRSLEYPELELSNDMTGNPIRPVTLRRENLINGPTAGEIEGVQRFFRSQKAVRLLKL